MGEECCGGEPQDEKCEECGKEECECEMSVEELANHADDKVDALIKLLIKKGVFTEDEYNQEFENLFKEE
ncbi:hypothetical protein ACFLZB_02890 [Nanoarchaeota archaeon]